MMKSTSKVKSKVKSTSKVKMVKMLEVVVFPWKLQSGAVGVDGDHDHDHDGNGTLIIAS